MATRPAIASSSGPANPAGQALVGAELGGFKLVELIGGGGMGLVFAAERGEGANIECPAQVAIKLLAPELSSDPDFVERFRREADALTRLRHPNLIEVYGKGEDPIGHFFVMERFGGADLRSVVTKGSLSPATIAAIVHQAALGLAYAHDHGVVHRDIKPANILVRGDPLAGGTVKVVDFGIAQLAGPAHALTSLTKSQLVLGTINYMSPEQRVDASEIDFRTDIYALGVVTYELLTGRLPIGVFEPPSELVKGLPKAIDPILTSALRREPRQRQSSIVAFAEGLEGALAPKRRSGLLASTIAAAAVGLLVVTLGARQILDAQPPKAKDVPALVPAADRLEKQGPSPLVNVEPEAQVVPNDKALNAISEKGAPVTQAEAKVTQPERRTLSEGSRRYGAELVRQAKFAAQGLEPKSTELEASVQKQVVEKAPPKTKKQKPSKL